MAKRTKKAAIPAATLKPDLDSTAYTEAVRVQCAVRDALEHPVTLVQALAFARKLIPEVMTPKLARSMRKEFEADAAALEEARIEEQKRIAANAGR